MNCCHAVVCYVFDQPHTQFSLTVSNEVSHQDKFSREKNKEDFGRKKHGHSGTVGSSVHVSKHETEPSYQVATVQLTYHPAISQSISQKILLLVSFYHSAYLWSASTNSLSSSSATVCPWEYL